ASRGVEARLRGLEAPLGSEPQPRPSTPALRAYAQDERVKGVGAGDSQEVKAPERRCGKKQRGIATVEFAIAVPVLLLLMLVAAEAGRWLYQYNTLHKAVRDGVRYLSSEALKGTTGVFYDEGSEEWQDIMEETKNIVVYGNRDGTGHRVLPGLTTGDITVTTVDGIHVRVEVNSDDGPYNYVPIFTSGIPTFGFGDGPINFDIDMTASATMRAL
ncbi:MAG: TadE family protein, partial [Gammaproteobacteria bacterium]